MTTKLVILLSAILASAILVNAQDYDTVRANKSYGDGSWYNITITSQTPDGPMLVKIIKTDEKGNVLFQDAYNDAITYYDGHMTSLITREGFSFKFDNAFGCFRRCQSISLVRGAPNPPLLATIEYPRCGGNC